MPKIRLMLLGLTAVFAMSAVAATSASAHNFKVEKKAITKTFKVEGVSGVSKLESAITGIGAVIRCEKDKFTGEIETEGQDKGTIEYEECKLFSEKEKTLEKECEVIVPITAKVKSELTEGPPVQERFSPGTGEIFVEIEIVNHGAEKCKFATPLKLPVTGSQLCKLPEGETEKTEHVIDCQPAGSKLFLGKEKAKLTSKEEKVKLTTKEKWSAV